MALLPNMDKLNLAVNGGFEQWSAGAGPFTGDLDAGADGWYGDEGTSSAFSIARNSADADTHSQYCAAVTYTHAATSSLYQRLSAAMLPIIKGRVISFGVRVKCTTAKSVYPYMSEDGGTTRVYGEPNTGQAGYQKLVVESFPPSASATAVVYGLEFRATNVAYVDNATLANGSAATDMQDTFDAATLGATSSGIGATELTQTKTANYTMTAADSGYVTTSQLDGIVYTLPSTAAGLTFTFMNTADDGAASLAVSPAAVDLIAGAGITAADNKDVINVKATAKRGDLIRLVGDGTNGWVIQRLVGTWAREA